MSGLLMQWFPPSKINNLYGYRTASSMRSQDRWDFAQRRGASELIRMGIALMVVSPIGIFINPRDWIAVSLGIGLLMIGVIVIIMRVEQAIRAEFDHDEQ